MNGTAHLYILPREVRRGLGKVKQNKKFAICAFLKGLKIFFDE
jgi:hypothetical protein